MNNLLGLMADDSDLKSIRKSIFLALALTLIIFNAKASISFSARAYEGLIVRQPLQISHTHILAVLAAVLFYLTLRLVIISLAEETTFTGFAADVENQAKQAIAAQELVKQFIQASNRIEREIQEIKATAHDLAKITENAGQLATRFELLTKELQPIDQFARMVADAEADSATLQSLLTARTSPLEIRDTVMNGIADAYMNASRRHRQKVRSTGIEAMEHLTILQAALLELRDETAKGESVISYTLKSAQTIAHWRKSPSIDLILDQHSAFRSARNSLRLAKADKFYISTMASLAAGSFGFFLSVFEIAL